MNIPVVLLYLLELELEVTLNVPLLALHGIMSSFYGIGLMSGNSLDGLDICHAEFLGNPNVDVWSYRMIKTETLPYSTTMKARLKSVARMSGAELIRLHHDYGRLVGTKTAEFIHRENIKPDFIAAAGHSAFHQPNKGLHFCLGDGETIAAYLPCPLVTNFENKDVELGGQGRPLVALGDMYLFSNFDFCLNLGGLAFVSSAGQAFDVCPCNVILNYLAKSLNLDDGLDYDKDGTSAARGEVIPNLLKELNELSYYYRELPKTLSREWFNEVMVPLFDQELCSLHDKLRTAVEHITDQIVAAIHLFPQSVGSTSPKGSRPRKILITGGGAKNKFLMRVLADKLDDAHDVTISECEMELVEYKEALIMAFLGMRTMLGLVNVSKDITGSKMDLVSGSIHLPPHHSKPTFLLKQ